MKPNSMQKSPGHSGFNRVVCYGDEESLVRDGVADLKSLGKKDLYLDRHMDGAKSPGLTGNQDSRSGY